MKDERLKVLRRAVTGAMVTEKGSVEKVRRDVTSLMENAVKGMDEDGGLQDAGTDLRTHASKLARLERLNRELETTPRTHVTEIAPVCYFEAIHSNTPDDVIKAYVVRNSALVPNAVFVTPESPIYKEISGKRTGSDFTIAGGTYRITVVE